MSDDEFKGGLLPGQVRHEPPAKVGEASGNRFVNGEAITSLASLASIAPAPFDLAAAVEAAKLQAEQVAQAVEERAKQAKVQADLSRATVRGYAEEVDKAVKVAAGIKPGGPPAPFHFRKGARALRRGQAPQWGWPGQQDPTLEALAILQSRGEWLSEGNLKNLDDAGLYELAIAESKAWSAMMDRARIVAGEA